MQKQCVEPKWVHKHKLDRKMNRRTGCARQSAESKWPLALASWRDG
jgi:hypothetical protein